MRSKILSLQGRVIQSLMTGTTHISATLLRLRRISRGVLAASSTHLSASTLVSSLLTQQGKHKMCEKNMSRAKGNLLSEARLNELKLLEEQIQRPSSS